MHTTSSTLFDHESMHGWGNMSGASMDFLAWDKWTAKFIGDSQVMCTGSEKTITSWIKPSTVSGIHEKLLIVKISSTKAIAIESLRNSGFNFKLPKCEQGVLIYILDVSILSQQTGLGLELVPNKSSKKMCQRVATYDVGDSVSLLGMKISVIEAGAFGDVVKVEKN
jgi:hypothetical protein